MILEADQFLSLVREMADYRQGRSQLVPRYGKSCYTSGLRVIIERNGQECMGVFGEGRSLPYRGPGADELNQSLRTVNKTLRLPAGTKLAVLFDDGKGAQAARAIHYCTLHNEVGQAIADLLDYNRFDEEVAVKPAVEEWPLSPTWF